MALVGAFGGSAGAKTLNYQRTLSITFPVAGPVRYGNDYHAGRGGGTRVHQSTDIFGRKLQRVFAAAAGTVTHIADVRLPVDNAGFYIQVTARDGLVYSYLHLNNDAPGTDNARGGAAFAYRRGLYVGMPVARGQFIGFLGDSGNAETTAPHLHFHITDPGLFDVALNRLGPAYRHDRVNPFPSLRAAQQRGDLPRLPPKR